MNKIMTINPIIIMTVLAAGAVVLCLFGLRTIRLWNAIAGAVLGVSAGTLACMLSGVDEQTGRLFVIGGAIVLGILAAVMKKTGSFIFCMVTVFGILNGIMYSQKWYIIAAYAAAAMLTAILSMIWMEPVLILITTVTAAYIAKNLAEFFCAIERWNPGYFIYAVPATVFLIGLFAQSMMKSREIGRKEIQYSKRVREESSVESEVEHARAILDGVIPEEKETDSVDLHEQNTEKETSDSKLKVAEHPEPKEEVTDAANDEEKDSDVEIVYMDLDK